jgi:hypothetical protein
VFFIVISGILTFCMGLHCDTDSKLANSLGSPSLLGSFKSVAEAATSSATAESDRISMGFFFPRTPLVRPSSVTAGGDGLEIKPQTKGLRILGFLDQSLWG